MQTNQRLSFPALAIPGIAIKQDPTRPLLPVNAGYPYTPISVPPSYAHTTHLSSDMSTDEDEDDVKPKSGKGKRKSSAKSKTEKSRDAAKQFRERQRARVHELEHQITDLEKERVYYEQQVEALKNENQLIREQQVALRKFIEQAFMKAYPEPSMTEKFPVPNQDTEKIFA